MIHSVAHSAYWKHEPEKDIWQSDEKVSMKNSPNLISFSEVSLEKIVMHGRHNTMVMKNGK
jgi:uncharacterized protein YbcV (DUF1398 family)